MRRAWKIGWLNKQPRKCMLLTQEYTVNADSVCEVHFIFLCQRVKDTMRILYLLRV